MPSATPRTPRGGERQATFRDVFASSEFRAIYAASALSWLGDYLARAAVTALVYQITNSVVASAAAFAISYTPWLIGGSVLVSLAERCPYRSVMVFCDVGRMMIMAAVAIPGIPFAGLMALVLCCALLTPPFDAARSATLPAVLTGDRYVVGVALNGTTAQPAQVAGYFLGAAMATHDPRTALLLNAATFGASALLVRFGVRRRQPALNPEARSDLLHETVDGIKVVFTTPALRSLIMIVFCGALLAVVPEGLGAAWAAHVADVPDRGWAQGMIMAAVPLGWILGALTMSRLVAPPARQRLIRPLAIATPLALIPAVFDPPAVGVACLAGACGFAMGGLVPVANGLFVQALPVEYRARAFGVVQGGLHLLQGSAVLVTGLLAQQHRLPVVVGLWSLCGFVLMLALSLAWPPPRVVRAAATPPLNEAQPPGVVGPSRHAWPAILRNVTGTAREAASPTQPGTMEQ